MPTTPARETYAQGNSYSTPGKPASVPFTPASAQASPAVDSPGTWRHPRLDEITRRHRASTFSEKNLRRVAYNIVFLFLLWFLQSLAKKYINLHIISSSIRSYLAWACIALQLVSVIQIGIECMPLVRTPDDISDIPLTATQRKLLGLPPSSTPPTPNAVYSTPPRYSRTPSLHGSVGSRASYNSSPLSGRGSPAFASSIGGSPFSPKNSPLLHRAVNGFSNGRRSSIGSPIPFSPNTSGNLIPEAGSAGGKRATVGLSNKWLYEKGRRSSSSAIFQ